jgi:hypothetical protein
MSIVLIFYINKKIVYVMMSSIPAKAIVKALLIFSKLVIFTLHTKKWRRALPHCTISLFKVSGWSNPTDLPQGQPRSVRRRSTHRSR